MAGTRVCKPKVLFGLGGFALFYLTILLASQWHESSSNHRIRRSVPAGYSSENNNDTEKVDISHEIEELLNDTRRMVLDQMADYQYPNGKYNISATKLEDFLIGNNGTPIRNIILSTYRSGSTFLGEVFGAHPGTFHHFEPLTEFGYIQIRGPPLSEKALTSIRGLFNCDYTRTNNLTVFETNYDWVFNRSRGLWWRCSHYKNMCYDHRYLSGYCKLFPFQLAKIVRLRLQVAQELLADEDLNVRLLLLVRDPRACAASRKHVFFYDRGPEISDTRLLCQDMVADYNVAVKLQRTYPNRFRVIRYEDLSADPYKKVEEISEFFRLGFHSKVREFLDTHTRTNSGGSFSTFRNTKTTPYHWRTELEFSEVEEIQQTCATAMQYWGYLPAINATHLTEFNPLTDYHLN